MIQLTAQQITLDASADGEPTRQITGLAVPWNVKATLSGGESVVFLEGSLPEDGPMPKLLEFHDDTRVIGRVTERLSTSDGLLFVAKLSATRAADDALALLADGALDSVSVGAVPTKFKRLADGTLEVSEAKFVELSVVTTPAYADAQVYSVAASSPDEEAPDEEEEIPTPTQPSEEDEMSEAIEAAAVPTAPIQFAAPKREFKLPTAAEYMVKFVAGGSEFAEFNQRIVAAAPNVTTTDTPGILPVPIVSPIYNNFINMRPLVSAMGVRQMPQSGKVFIRPKVVTNTTIGASNGELVPLDQGTFVVDDIQITKALYGGYVKLSEESMDMTSPEVLGALIDDMGRVYANATDAAACATFEAGVTQTQVLADVTDPADWVSFIYGAAQQILTNSNGNLPNVLVLSPSYYASLGALVDTAGRPLFPNVGPMNAVGTGASASTFNGNAFGLSLVVDRNITSIPIYVGDSTGFECWEQQKGALSVELADGALGRVIKFRGYFSSVMIDGTKFVTKD